MRDSIRVKGRVLAILAGLVLVNLLLPWHEPFVTREFTRRVPGKGLVVVQEIGRTDPVRGWEMPVPLALAVVLAAAAGVQSYACLWDRPVLERRMRKWVGLLAVLHLCPMVAILLEQTVPKVGSAFGFALSIGVLLAGLGTFQE